MNVRSIALGALVTLAAVSPAAAQTAAQPAPPREQPAATRQVQGFNIVLVLGETQPGSGVEGSDDIPAGAKKALADMREFLPYKNYRVLDTQWTSCCAGVNSVLSGQLRGIAAGRGGSSFVDRQYSFHLTVNNSSQGLSVRFGLNDGAVASARKAPDEMREQSARVSELIEREDLRDRIATMELQVREAEKKVAVGVLPSTELRVIHDKHASLVRQHEAVSRAVEGSQAPSRGSIIDSSFVMQPGETVVVGTSRLGGDKAIIALVTAARKTGSTR